MYMYIVFCDMQGSEQWSYTHSTWAACVNALAVYVANFNTLSLLSLSVYHKYTYITPSVSLYNDVEGSTHGGHFEFE